jgi:hypothetical protein
MADSPVQVGGAYQESEDHVPNPTDMVAQFNTSGLGAHGRIEEVSPIFEVDKVKTAQEILAATDPDNDAVGSDRVLLPNPVEDNDVALDQITELAERRVEKGVVIGGPTPAESEAELEGDEGVLAAVEQERSNAAANSTGNRQAGQHEGTVSSDEGKDDTALAGSTRSWRDHHRLDRHLRRGRRRRGRGRRGGLLRVAQGRVAGEGPRRPRPVQVRHRRREAGPRQGVRRGAGRQHLLTRTFSGSSQL